MSNRNKEIRDSKSFSKLLSSIIIGLILISVCIVAIGSFLYINASQKPLNPDDKSTTKIEILPGESATMIGEKLEKEKIIKSSTMFKYYLKFNNISNFQAGNYELSPSMTFKQIAKSLQKGEVYIPVVFKMNIPEGVTIDQIGDIVAKHTNIAKEDFVQTVNNPEFIKKMQKKHPKLITKAVFNKQIKAPLEGYLYPATYDFTEKNPSTEEIVDKMLTATEDNAFPLWDKYGGILINEAGKERRLSFHEFLTFASLVEREATGLTDRAKIASVFINRMASNPAMPLQTDPTVLYALGRHKAVTYEEDLKVDSPYNTYKNTGLPPGPIATSGKESMESVLNPAKTDYLYFLASKDGKNYFSKTYEEHLKLKEEHIDSQQ
ncbi:endolytic transglycosylase MltG [Macrococcoides caseolyticum]|uniref:endolytic transglycosylase MltG n=1 Tax=Macrococcoides caseolyticum TaxID=69966 RepID=UPI001F16BFBC|nr:endolytic transglycosylase MltG [Macrococcus caseolyticus]MCE4956186.1 endolytic transglycosylase MltG [Macrococcus caseolyticus]